jgi:hypothetical protein
MSKKEQKFGNSGTLAQEVQTGFIYQRGMLPTPNARDWKDTIGSGKDSPSIGVTRGYSLINSFATNTNGNGLHQCNCDDEINASERRINAFGNANKIPSDWEKFPTQSPICGGDDGIPTELDGITFSKWRAESIKGYGNAIVPQVALELFKVIEKINCNLSK